MEERHFENLSQEEQIERLRLLAEVALTEFGIYETQLEPLVHAENTTFCVTSNLGKFCIRLCRPGYRNHSQLESEVQWLSALSAAGFEVPKPFRDKIVKVSHRDVPDPRTCLLFHWMEGDICKERLTPEEAHRLGVTMAKLHEFALNWTLPYGFSRPGLHDWAFEGNDIACLKEPSDRIFEEDREFLLDLDLQSRTILGSLEQSPENFGLIHGDLHRHNLLFNENHLKIIDFDDAGWAFWLYDFAAALAYELDGPHYEQVQAALFDGYQTVRPLPPRTLELLKPFLQMRLAGVACWVMERTDNPDLRKLDANWVHGQCEKMRALA